jgi:capsular polysaccharide biosynthesis protein/Mrp family chromosome partitioning ATPase
MEIDVYLQVIRRWILLIIVMTAAAAAIGYVLIQRQPTSYSAQVQLLVGPGVDNTSSNLNVLRASTTVMQTYAQLATTKNLLQQVITELKLDMTPNNLASQITVTPNTDAQIITVVVHSTNQKQAIAIANTLAHDLVNLHSVKDVSGPAGDVGALDSQANAIQTQIARSQARINQLQSDLKSASDVQNQPAFADEQNRIKDLEAQIAAPTDPALAKDIQDHQTRIQQLQAALGTAATLDARRMTLDELNREDQKLDSDNSLVSERKRLLIDQLSQEHNRLQSMQTANADLQNQILSQLSIERAQLGDAQRNLATIYPTLQNGFSSQIILIDPATTATPETSKAPLIAAVAGLGGLVLALTLAFAYEYLDDKIKTPDQLAQATGVRVWDSINKKSAPRSGWLQRNGNRSDGMSEALRRLSIGLTPNGSGNASSVLVSSLERNNDWAAVVASNLAVALARVGKRVILVDANIRQPKLGALFQVDGRTGLADWLAGTSEEPGLIPIASVPGLWLLPVGFANGEVAQDLAWPRMEQLIKSVEPHTDVLIVAGPPLSSSADSYFLASHLGGVLGIATKGKTRRKAAAEIVENLRSSGIRVLGMILADGRVQISAGKTSSKTGTSRQKNQIQDKAPSAAASAMPVAPGAMSASRSNAAAGSNGGRAAD